MGDLQYKGANVSSIQHDDSEGTVRAIVSVTGIVDNVKDIIAPGAYEKSLKNRIPKGVWQHQWTESIAKTTAIKELMPGDPDLPKTLANGQPWPAEAGGLLVDMVFNMKTQRGRDAYEDVKFYDNQQEWSIGYSVPAGGATKDSRTGIRTIHTLDLYEYSPVLFGAMSNARTTSVKSAQSALLEMKGIFGDDTERILEMTKGIFDIKSDKPDNHDDDQDDDDLDDDGDFVPPKEKKGESEVPTASVPSKDLITNAINALQALLNSAGESGQPNQEEKSLYDLMEEAGIEGKILDTADDFDDAIDEGDIELAEKSALPLLDLVEAMVTMDGVDEKTAEDYRGFASYIGDNLVDLQEKSDDGGADDGDDEEIIDDEDDIDEVPEKKSFERITIRDRSIALESKSAIETDGLALFSDSDESEYGF